MRYRKAETLFEVLHTVGIVASQIATWWFIYYFGEKTWHAKDATTATKNGVVLLVIVILYAAAGIIQALISHKEQTLQAINRAGRKW